MGKLSKRDLKEQKKIQDLINSKQDFTGDELELIYTEVNEAIIVDVTQSSAFFTPLGGLIASGFKCAYKLRWLFK